MNHPVWSAKGETERPVTAVCFAHARLACLAILLFLALDLPAAAQSNWKVEVVDGGPGHNYGSFTSLVIDSAGNFHIGYHDETENAVRYAFRAKNEKEWRTMQVDAGGAALSLAVDEGGFPRFAYVGPYEAGLRYAYWDGTKWHKQTLDPEKINFFNSIQLNADGLPRISYYHRLWQDGSYALQLKYAFFDGQAWYTETVDPEENTGKFNSLALDSKGLPHISYSDVGAGDLRYAYYDGKRWHFSTPDTHRAAGGWVGLGSCIVLDPSDNPHIAHIAVSQRKIRYTWWTGSRWETEIVDSLVGRADSIDRVSLKLDSKGRPHIAYYDSGLDALKYAVRLESGWQIERVDPDSGTGFNPSLFLDREDQPFVSYHDTTNGTLRFAARTKISVSATAKKSSEQ